MTFAQDPLPALTGEWLGTETIAASRWGIGGPARSRVVSRLALDGALMVQDYAGERDGKRWLDAHAVFSLQRDEPRYRLFWFDSLGFVPSQPAPGAWDSDAGTLMFTRSSPRGQTRHVYFDIGEAAYKLRLESSFDGGVSWEPVMAGVYERIGRQP